MTRKLGFSKLKSDRTFIDFSLQCKIDTANHELELED